MHAADMQSIWSYGANPSMHITIGFVCVDREGTMVDILFMQYGTICTQYMEMSTLLMGSSAQLTTLNTSLHGAFIYPDHSIT